MYAVLEPPERIARTLRRETEQVSAAISRRLSKVSRAKRVEFERHLSAMYQAHQQNTSPMRKELQSLNDFYEGAEEANDHPFGAESSQIDLRLASATASTLRAQFIRSVFNDPVAYVADLAPAQQSPDAKENLDSIEEAVNWVAESDCNFNDTLKDTLIPAFIDGLVLIHGEWERRIERGCDYAIYQTSQEFMEDYPDPESAGVSEDEYSELLDSMNTYQEPLHVSYELDFVSRNAPVFSLCHLAKFIWHPQHVSHERDFDMYGYGFTMSETRFEEEARQGAYYADAVDAVRKKHSGSDRDAYDRSRDIIEGISDEMDYKASYRMAKLVVLYDLDGDGVPERHTVIWSVEANRCLRIEKYDLRRNVACMVPFRLVKRSGRWLGVSLLKDTEYLYRILNALHRHRSNVRRLTDTVTLIIPESLKEPVDLGAEYATFRAGMTLWVPDNLSPEKYPRQLQLYNLSRNGDSQDEEGLINRYIELRSGISQGASGRESMADPRAPASKTAMLLNRSDIRVEDLVGEWQRSIPAALDLLRTLYFQNRVEAIKYGTRQSGKAGDLAVPPAMFAEPSVVFSLKGVNSSTSPEHDMNRIATAFAMAQKMQIPITARPQMVLDLWNDFIVKSRIEAPERFIISQDQQGGLSMGGEPVQNAEMIQQLMSQMAQGPAQAMPTSKPNGAAR